MLVALAIGRVLDLPWVMASSPNDTHRAIEPSVLYVGTPVYLVATQNPDGTTNLAPASSHFALGRTVVLGLEDLGQSLANIRRDPEFTVNFPEAAQWAHVERLAKSTGRNPVPPEKAGHYLFEPRKFQQAGLTPAASELIAVPRVAEAPIQLECRAVQIVPAATGGFCMVEAEVLRVHARRDIIVAGTDHLDPGAWHPLIYIYRHFFDRGAEVGWTDKTPFVQAPRAVARWEETGGQWNVAGLGESYALVELRQCDGGQVVETVRLKEPREVLWAKRQLELG